MNGFKVRRYVLGVVVGLVGVGVAAIPALPASAAASFTQISAGGGHSCGITPGGAVKCWGSNGHGQLGNATNTNSNVPVQVSGITSGATAVGAGSGHSCAVVTGGAVKCWGDNFSGQLGNGTFTTSNVPVTVSGITSGATTISAGSVHSCADRKSVV